jgi:hypothetical protein
MTQVLVGVSGGKVMGIVGQHDRESGNPLFSDTG